MTVTRTVFSTDPGPRDSLEDTVRAIELAIQASRKWELSAHLVCDGVGGHSYGEVASALGAECFLGHLAGKLVGGMLWDNWTSPSPDSILDLLIESLAFANRTILQEADKQPPLKGMATTAVCAVILDGMLYVAWAGDSRCYLHSRGTIKQLTHDHSEIQKLIDAGLINEREAKNHPLGHTITQFLGRPHGFACDTKVARLTPGDVVLLCSDGLTDVVGKAQIADFIRACRSGCFAFDELPKQLIYQALEAGTTDNVTVLCCEYQPECQTFGKTLTGEYPVVAASAVRNLIKETPYD